jgi:hypothetical protein
LLGKKTVSLGASFILFTLINSVILLVPEWFFIYLFMGLSVFFFKKKFNLLFIFIFSVFFLLFYLFSYAYLNNLSINSVTDNLIPNYFCFDFFTPFMKKHKFVFYFILYFLFISPFFLYFGFWTQKKINNLHLEILFTFLLVLLMNLFLVCSWKYSNGFYLSIGLYFPVIFSYIAYYFKWRWVMELLLLSFLILLLFF